jgi:hypothetical protein
MEKIKQFIQDPAWWFTLIIGGLLLSIFAQYLVRGIDKLLSAFFKSYRQKSNIKKHSNDLNITEIAIDNVKLLQLNVNYLIRNLHLFILTLFLLFIGLYGDLNSKSAIIRVSTVLLIQVLLVTIFCLLYSTFKILTKIKSASKLKEKILLYDDFKVYEGWENYLGGFLTLNANLSYRGDFSLEKCANPDPSGGYKKLAKPIKLGLLFSGCIYSPSERGERKTGFADRLAIEDENFNGYGFCVAHGIRKLMIEQRVGGEPSNLAVIDFNPPSEQWYHFKFYMKVRGIFDLEIYDASLNQIANLRDVQDKTYNVFDRVAIHGGFPYYVGYLKVEKIEE